MFSDGISLTKKCLDPSVVDHFSSQLMNGVGEATGVKFQIDSILPCLETEVVIGGFRVSYP